MSSSSPKNLMRYHFLSFRGRFPLDFYRFFISSFTTKRCWKFRQIVIRHSTFPKKSLVSHLCFYAKKRLELAYPKFISNFLLHISARFVFCLDHQTFCKWQRWMTFYDCYLFFLLLCTNVEIAFLIFPGLCVQPEVENGKVTPIKASDSGNFLVANVSCNANYKRFGKHIIKCMNGIWSSAVPSCIRKYTWRNCLLYLTAMNAN